MERLVEIVNSLNEDDRLPVGLLTGAGLIYGLLVSETTFEEESKASLRKSSRGGGGFFTGHDGSAFQHVLNAFDTRRLGADPEGLSLPLVHSVVSMDMMSAEVPAMRVNPKQVISWWVTEHRVEGAKFQGGGMGVSF